MKSIQANNSNRSSTMLMINVCVLALECVLMRVPIQYFPSTRSDTYIYCIYPYGSYKKNRLLDLCCDGFLWLIIAIAVNASA